MPREINVQVEMEMDMNQITRDIVNTLTSSQGSSEMKRLSTKMDEELVKGDSDGETVGSYQRQP